MNMFSWLLDFVTPLNNFFQNFSILVYNNTIISLRLIVYYLIIANSGPRPSFAIYQTIYDSPLRDNCCVSNYLICVETSFFRDSVSRCSCCVRVVVAVHDYQKRDKVSTSSLTAVQGNF